MITKNKIKEMLIHWDMQNEEITDFYSPTTGRRADNVWHIASQCLLKVGTNITGLENHICISKALFNQGLNASLPVRTTSGNDYTVDGELYFYMTNKITGTPLSSIFIHDSNALTTARYLGEIIGELHLTLAKFDNNLICNEPDFLQNICDFAIPKIREISSLPQSFFTDYITHFSKLFPNLPKQIIHRDLNPSNILMADHNLVGFIDFELSERNIRIFDPCYAATAILSEVFTQENFDEAKWFDVYQNILIGYDSVVHLSHEEKATLPYVIIGNQFVFTAYFVGLEKHQALATTNLKMLDWLIKNKEKLDMYV